MSIKKILFITTCIVALYAFQKPLIVDPFEKIFLRLEKYRKHNTPEKVYVHTDKPYYTNGETIWFNNYLVDGITHTKSEKSKVIYTELIDPNDSIISRKQLYTKTLSINGDFEIPKDAQEGTYLIRSYTNYMRNSSESAFFQKEIQVWNQTISNAEIATVQTEELISKDSIVPRAVTTSFDQEKPKLKFYPEGGYLVTGIPSVMGVKITDPLGNGLELQGTIKDQNGINVSFFRTYRFGLGNALFKPEIGKKYYASVIVHGVEEKYPLPQPLLSGYVLNINSTEKDIVIKVSTNRSNGLNNILLLGHLRGVPFLKHTSTGLDSNEETYTVKLSKNSIIGSGVAQFTLFTPVGDPVCERLVFIDNEELAPIAKITTDKERYGTREPAMISFAVKDIGGTFLEGEFSLSITEKNNVIHDPESASIKSWFLLDSDLKGTIQNPGSFFVDTPKKNNDYLLDALMLTHGWRRFVWKDLLKDKVEKEPNFITEKGIMIRGRTTVLNKPYQPKFSSTSINFFSDSMYEEKKYTDKNGRFSFGPYVLIDSVKTIVQAIDPSSKNESKSRQLSIHIDPPIPSPLVERSYKRPLSEKTISFGKRYLAMARRKKIIDYQYDPESTILEEVVLLGKTKTKTELINEEIEALTNYSEPQTRLFVDSIAGGSASTILDLISRAPGVQVIEDNPNPQIIIGAGGFAQAPQPLILLDGFQVAIEQITAMSASDVSFIDVLGSSEASTLGPNTAGGAIAIYTHRGFSFSENQSRSPGITNFVSPGFYKAREFFAPEYYKENSEYQKPDFRTTLYWDPHVVCTTDSNALVNFYTDDTAGEYLIHVEGITKTGVPIKVTQSFVVE